MRIFIDESGNFSESSDWGVVCSLAIPDKQVGPARRELTFRSKHWRRENGELKGGLIDFDQFSNVVDILFRNDAIMHAVGIIISDEIFSELEQHKNSQALGITRHITSDHHPNVVSKLQELRRTLEGMPVQLYVQCCAQSELVVTAIEECANYFAQRRPYELSQFQWTIDAKDPKNITTQEKWWKETLGPLLESRSRADQFKFVKDKSFNFMYFNRSFAFTKELWNPDKTRESVNGIDIGKIIVSKIEFLDSRSDIMLQCADILSNHLRRILSQKIDDARYASTIGKLQIARRLAPKASPQTVRIISLSQDAGDLKRPTLKAILDSMAKSSRSMVRSSR